MATPITGQAQGLIQTISQKAGQPAAVSIGWHNELLTSELLPRYACLALAGVVYTAVNTVQQALSLSGTTTYTGLVIANPANSGKNLILIDASFGLGTLQGGLGAIAFFSGTTVALTTGNSSGPKGVPTLLGTSGSSAANVGASATLGANPILIRAFAGTQWVTTGTTSNIQIVKDEVAGLIVIPPGQLMGIVAVSTAVTGIASLTWGELSV